MLVTTVSPAKTAESIGWVKESCIKGCTYGRHLANKIERSVLGSDAGSCYHHCNNLLLVVDCKNYPYMHIYFVASLI